MTVTRLYLVCNSHIDPVWLWMWQEGLAETLTTFRTAAEFCEEFDDFVFCHNEALLYQWVETYEPNLFSRIQDLVQKGRWHIMGGWYVQPDCNLPCGESFVRQALVGKRYFREKFNVEPHTAVNFDPFGHTRGLVQILAKAGYDSYLFCRPDPEAFSLPADSFIWQGYDGSHILAHRAPEHYNSQQGKAAWKVTQWLKNHPQAESGILLWGIGNHGGGPSRSDLKSLRTLISSETSTKVMHGTPEDYFKSLSTRQNQLPVYDQDLNPWAVGCYTSMARIKEKHRRLESLFLTTEKTSAHAYLNGILPYPSVELDSALQDLLYCQFHDILPGSCTAEVEVQALQRMSHALEILERIQNRAFFCLLSGHAAPREGEFPVMVYNPHPHSVRETLFCEFQPPEPNFVSETFWQPEMRDEKGVVIPCQLERESSNIAVDQRKRVTFSAELAPWEMKRYSVYLRDREPLPDSVHPLRELLELPVQEGRVVLDASTGRVSAFERQGKELLLPDAFRLLVMEDYPDPWGMKVQGFRNLRGSFELMTPWEAARFSGSHLEEIPPVRIVEQGPVRTVVEALFQYERSTACVHYLVPENGTAFELAVRIYWNEKDRMLKLSVPTLFIRGSCRGQVAYGVEKFPSSDQERVAQKWVAALSEDRDAALSVINSRTYGFDYNQGELRFSLLRSAAYAAHPVADEIPIVPGHRFIPRIDQGEHVFRFWIGGGVADPCLQRLDQEALLKNEPPNVLCCYPTGLGRRILPAIICEEEGVTLTCLKRSEDGKSLILRFFESTGNKQEARIRLPLLDLSLDLVFDPFEIKTLEVTPKSRAIRETDLLERKIARDPQNDPPGLKCT